jgi:hypothetical protein
MWLLPAGVFGAEAEGGSERGPRRGERGGREGRDPEEMRRRMEEFRRRNSERLREALAVKDKAEWDIIEKRIEAVREARDELRGGRRGFFGFFDPRRGGRFGGRGPGEGRRPGGPEQPPQSEVGQKMQALGELLQKEDAKSTDIAAALKALRGARATAQKKLDGAQATLREVLTQRQEAMLVMMGMLD